VSAFSQALARVAWGASLSEPGFAVRWWRAPRLSTRAQRQAAIVILEAQVHLSNKARLQRAALVQQLRELDK
jgi:hypothetical protein